MEALYTKTKTIEGYNVTISVHRDENMGEPWKEHDGHGIVSDWTTRDKRAGELVLASDRDSKRYYDFAATVQVAKRDGWGMGEKWHLEQTKKLGRKPTRNEEAYASVMCDYERLRGWCNDEWHWKGFTTIIETPDGETVNGESVWGYDDAEYMIEEALSSAEHTVRKLMAAAIGKALHVLQSNDKTNQAS